MIGPLRADVDSIPPPSPTAPSVPQETGQRGLTRSPQSASSMHNPHRASADQRIVPPRPELPRAHSSLRPSIGARTESRNSLRVLWENLGSDDGIDAVTAPERRLQYTVRSQQRTSFWPLINLLSASVGRSFVSLAGGLLADGVRDGMQPGGSDNAGINNATSMALNISRSAISQCITALNVALNATSETQDDVTQATELGAAGCLVSLNAALASTANQTQGIPLGQAGRTTSPKFVPGGTLLGLGVLLFCFGAGRFAWDTSKIDRKRALLMGSLSFSGFALVVTGNSVSQYALDSNQLKLQKAMLLPRLLGTYLIFLSIPKSFSTCELVRGDARLPHREWIRGQLGAWGPVVFALWGSILSYPNLEPSIHEMLLSLALMMLVIANALSETNVARARAAALVQTQCPETQTPAVELTSVREMPER